MRSRESRVFIQALKYVVVSVYVVQGGASYGSVPGAAAAAAAGNGDSKRAQRLRSLYVHMRQLSAVVDGDRALLVRPAAGLVGAVGCHALVLSAQVCETNLLPLQATISQESALEGDGSGAAAEPAAAALFSIGSAPGAGDGVAEQTADDVLEEVDAALQAAQEAMQYRRRGGGGSTTPPWGVARAAEGVAGGRDSSSSLTPAAQVSLFG